MSYQHSRIFLPTELKVIKYSTEEESLTGDDCLRSASSREVTRQVKNIQAGHCRTILEDNQLLRQLKDAEFELTLVHGSPLTRY